MEDQVRRAQQVTLNDALRQRARLDSLIEYLRERLGSPTTPVPAPSRRPHDDVRSVEHGDSAPVTADEFQGVASLTAAATVLARVGRPMKTAELFAAIQAGGVGLKGKNAPTTFSQGLRKDARIEWVAPGTWALASKPADSDGGASVE